MHGLFEKLQTAALLVLQKKVHDIWGTDEAS